MTIRSRGNSHQVRIAGDPPRSFPTRQAAELYELNRKLARSLGELHAEQPITVREALVGCLHRWQATKSPAPATLARARESCNVWIDELGDRLLSELTVAEPEDIVVARAVDYPNAAKKELEWLKRGLRDAQRRGQRFDHGILLIDPVRSRPRDGIALDEDKLARLGSWFPDQLARMPEILGSVGLRLGEALTLEEDRVDVDAGTLFIPAALCKERRDKLIELASFECTLIAEQLIARTPGTTFVFPRAGGRRYRPGPWGKTDFYKRVWYPARDAAAREWRTDYGLGDAAPTPFDGLVPHDLRHSAISRMAAAGMQPEHIATRVGHNDGGVLVLRRYRHLFPREQTAQLGRYDAHVRDRRRQIETEAFGG